MPTHPAITAIEVTDEQIIIRGEGLNPASQTRVHELTALEPPAAADTHTDAWHGSPRPEGGLEARLDRFDGPRDRLYSQWIVRSGDAPLAGARFATRVAPTSANREPYPRVETIKGLQVRTEIFEDALELGVRHAALNLNQGDIMRPGPGEGLTPFVCDGQTYYFDEAYLAHFDAPLKQLSDAGIVVTLILLNSPNWRRPLAPELRETLLHPTYNEEGFISAFNVVEPRGYAHYKAFCEFVARRYSEPEAPHGRVRGYIVGNEIDSQWVWGNAGEMPVEQYMHEYGRALRTAWLAVRKYDAEAHVYISLDHLWTITHLDNPLRTYPSRTCLELLNQGARDAGDYDWGVAFHPYPEDLRYPDFWNDQSAPESLDAPRITFKNIEQLPRFLRQPEFLYEGRQRPITLSEQGFNSHGDEESEAFQAAAYALAYRKIEATEGIESFILHAHVDNLREFGLNLGLWRVDSENKPTRPKPIHRVFKEIDGPNGDRVYREALPFLERRMDRRRHEKLF